LVVHDDEHDDGAYGGVNVLAQNMIELAWQISSWISQVVIP